MKNLSLLLLELVLISLPACFALLPKNECFSQSLIPSYPCCRGNRVIYSDKDGRWGIENGRWCGIGNGIPINASTDTCFSIALGYPCCQSCNVAYTDKSGKWGIENRKWCGIKDSCTSPVEIIEEPVQNATDVSNVSNTNFDLAFLKMENNKKNMLYSPLSVEYALKMLQEGAAENTLAEINKVVGNIELPKYSSIDKNLSLANGLFIRNTYYEYVKELYINTLKEKYNAEIKKDEFKDAQNANKWIEDKTLGIIKNMLKDDVVGDPTCVMLLINALAIDMEWVYSFDYDDTYGGTFYKDDGNEIKATMMSIDETKTKAISYYKADDITVLTMDLKDYNGTQFEFMAIMPKENLSAYVENVTDEQIENIDKNLKLASDTQDGVNVRIPKFKYSYDLSLKKDLVNLGIKDAFDKKSANLSKIADPDDPEKRLYVSDALHKADIEFSEEGVKAAAVTVMIMNMVGSAMPVPKFPIDIIINKPFMFIIRDKATKDIWFTGTVYEPNLWENDKSDYSPSRPVYGPVYGPGFGPGIIEVN